MATRKQKKRKTLIARFDVTGLPKKEIEALQFYVHVQAEGERDADDLNYRSVPGPDMLVIDENVPAWHAELSSVIRDTFLEGRDQEAMALMGELVNTDATRKALTALLANWEYDTPHYTEEVLGERVWSGAAVTLDDPRNEFYKMAERIIAIVFRGE